MKPSIFSREYEKKMRRRKKIIATLAILLIIAAGAAFAGKKLNVNATLTSAYKKTAAFFGNIHLNFGKQKGEQNKKAEQDKQTSNVNNIQTKTQTDKDQEKFYDLSFDGIKAKAVYDETSNGKKYKYLTFEDGNKIIYNINPSGTGIVLFDSSAQTISFLDINGSLADISNASYTSTDGTVFNREEVLKERPGYVWCTSPRFIDDKNIVYVSQVPWFDDRGTEYIWSVNTDSKKHVMARGIEGDSIKFGNIDDKGLQVNINDKPIYLKYSGDEGVVIQ